MFLSINTLFLQQVEEIGEAPDEHQVDKDNVDHFEELFKFPAIRHVPSGTRH